MRPWEDRVMARMREARDSQDALKRKVYGLRKFVAGDLSAIGGAPSSREDAEVFGQAGEFYDFIVDTVTEGKSNRLLEAVRTLLFQTTFSFPEIEFEDLDGELAAINSGVCKVLLGDPPKGCGTLQQLKRSLLDYLVCGIGWGRIAFDSKTGAPGIKFADTLDMLWDNRKWLPSDIRWASCGVRETGAYWSDFFGKSKPFQSIGEDQVCEVHFYYDTDTTENGRFAAFLVGESGQSLGLVEAGENPFYYLEQGQRIPYLPYEPMYFLALPSTRSPVGIVEMAMSDQLAVWQSEEVVGNTAQRMVPWVAVPKDSMEDDALEAFRSGETGAMVEFSPQVGPPIQMGGGDVSQTLLQRLDRHEKRIVAMAGVNPYASGAPVSGVKYAAEANEIATQSGLTVGTVSRDNAAFWVRLVRKFLGAVALYGDFPITIRYDGVPMSFGPEQPIKDFIVPDADIVIREDTTVFTPRAERIQEASAKLGVAMQLAQQYPQAVEMAFEEFLRASGEQNVSPWLEKPDMMAGAPVQDAAAMQDSSTAQQ